MHGAKDCVSGKIAWRTHNSIFKMTDEVEDSWKIYCAQLRSLLDASAYKVEGLGETWSYSQSAGSA